jgi:hypothetical protein
LPSLWETTLDMPNIPVFFAGYEDNPIPGK